MLRPTQDSTRSNMTTVSLFVEAPVTRPLSLEDIAINIATETFLRGLMREFILMTAYTDVLSETFVSGNLAENQVRMAMLS